MLRRVGVGLSSVGVFEEDTVSATNSPFSIPPWIPSKSHSRSRVKPMAFHAAIRYARSDAALNESIGEVGHGGRQQWIRREASHHIVRINRRLPSHIVSGSKVKGLVLFFSIGLKEAES